MGAVVVDSTRVQLNAYILDLTEEEVASLTFSLEYGTKAPRRICSAYLVEDKGTKGREETSMKDRNGAFVKLFDNSNPPVAPYPLQLNQNFPNPFSAHTLINYSLAKKGTARISIYNIRGQMVRSFSNEAQKSGKYQVTWDGRDKNKLACSSGIYFCCLETQGQRITKKMLLLK